MPLPSVLVWFVVVLRLKENESLINSDKESFASVLTRLLKGSLEAHKNSINLIQLFKLPPGTTCSDINCPFIGKEHPEQREEQT